MSIRHTALYVAAASAKFDVEKPVHGQSIILISDLIGKKLIDHFKNSPGELKRIDRRKFEELVAELFDGFGYEVEITKRTRDGGKDIIAIKNDIILEKFLIECKRPDTGNYIGVSPVRELYGVKTSEQATKAIMVTTTYYSRDAKLIFDKHKWELEGKDYDDLILWIDQYNKLKDK